MNLRRPWRICWASMTNASALRGCQSPRRACWGPRTICAKFPSGRLSLPHRERRGKPQLFNNRLGDLIKMQFIMAEAVEVFCLVWREPCNDFRCHRIAFIDEFLQHACHAYHVMKHD